MVRSFCETLSSLRRARSLSQRAVAADLKISQALLSHYENGAREPGLAFVIRTCDYYGVSADYMLGRTENAEGMSAAPKTLKEVAIELKSLANITEALSEELHS